MSWKFHEDVTIASLPASSYPLVTLPAGVCDLAKNRRDMMLMPLGGVPRVLAGMSHSWGTSATLSSALRASLRSISSSYHAAETYRTGVGGQKNTHSEAKWYLNWSSIMPAD